MRIVVTGASGKLGVRVAARLRTDGHEVGAVTSPRASVGTPLDLTDPAAASVLATFRPEAIVHLAGALPRRGGDDWLQNPSMTSAVTEAARATGARVILASTAAVYGDQLPRPAKEEDALADLSGYARSKRESEAVVLAAPESVALRIFNVHGPGFDDSLVSRLLRSTPAAPAQVRDPDMFVRDYVHSDEVARVVSHVVGAELPRAHVTINVGSGVAVSNRRLLELIARVHTPAYAELKGDPSYSVADMAAATALLGFTPASRLPGEDPASSD